MKKSLQKKLQRVKCLIMDVDGVLTEGYITLDSQGNEIKTFDVYDGFGIVVFRRAGYKTAILSARSAPAVTARAQDLKIDKICQGAYPKLTVYEDILKSFDLKDEEVCFIGDDLPDLAVLNKVGVAVAVQNAVPEIKKQADYITQKPGGRGAVREVIELILTAKKLWPKIVKDFT